MNVQTLLNLANLEKRDRYLSSQASAQPVQKTDWRWVGFDSTTGEGVVENGVLTRRAKVISSGGFVAGQVVAYSQDGEFGVIEGMPYVRPQPKPKPQFVPTPDRELQAWAIGGRTLGTNQSFILINLITGQVYPLPLGGGISTTIPPCGTVPPNAPIPSPLPPQPGVPLPWYRHIWKQNASIAGARILPDPQGLPIPSCSPFPQIPPGAGAVSGSTIFARNVSDGADWILRTDAGSTSAFTAVGPFTFINSSLTTVTQSPTPPATPSEPLAVTSTALVGTGWSGTYIGVQLLGWTYTSTACPALNVAPEISPPIDFRNPNGAPIPNTIETSLSIGPDLLPIAMVRHTPNCASPGVWNFERSYRVENNQAREFNGRLDTDWRYGPDFPCRNTFAADRFANFDAREGADRSILYSIEPDDRPTAIQSQAPSVQIKITEKRLGQGCTFTNFDADPEDVAAIVRGPTVINYDILNIAILITE